MDDEYRLTLFRYGFIGKAEPHPLRCVQALLRARASGAEAIDRFFVLTDIRAELDTVLMEGE